MPVLRCSLHSARVDDFVGALKQLHVDFHWPFPVLSLSALQHVASGLFVTWSVIVHNLCCLFVPCVNTH